MDPGVRLTYELDQVNLLGGSAAAAVDSGAAAAIDPGVGGAATMSPGNTGATGSEQASWTDSAAAGSRHDVSKVPGLGPRLPWQQVAATSAQLAIEAKQRAAAAAACRQQQQRLRSDSICLGDMVECCDLQPGHAYVNFRSDCRMVNVVAHNHTAVAFKHVTIEHY